VGGGGRKERDNRNSSSTSIATKGLPRRRRQRQVWGRNKERWGVGEQCALRGEWFRQSEEGVLRRGEEKREKNNLLHLFVKMLPEKGGRGRCLPRRRLGACLCLLYSWEKRNNFFKSTRLAIKKEGKGGE